MAGCVARILREYSRAHERRHFCTVEPRAHDTHALAIAPVQVPSLIVERQLLGRASHTGRHQHTMLASIEIRALDRAVVRRHCTGSRIAIDQMDAASHVGPVDHLVLGIDLDAVGRARQVRDDDLVRTVRRQRDDRRWTCLQDIQRTAILRSHSKYPPSGQYDRRCTAGFDPWTCRC